MDTLVFWVIFIFFTCISLLLMLIKTKTIELITVHLILMLASIVIGASQMWAFDNILTLVFCLLAVTTFLGNVLSLQVG